MLKINGKMVEDREIEFEMERLRGEYERVFSEMEPAEREGQLLEWSKENVIEKVLIWQAAQESSVEVADGRFEARMEQVKTQFGNEGDGFAKLSDKDKEKIVEQVSRELKTEAFLEQVSGDIEDPSSEEVAVFYEENKEQFLSEEVLRAGHIVKHIDWRSDEKQAYEEMLKVKEDLIKGVVFEDLAYKHSDCPDNGGDLGYIRRGEMVEEFEAAAFNLGSGEVSDIFKTRFGYHIVKVYEHREPEQMKLEDVRDGIVEHLKGGKRTEKIESYVDELKLRAKIEESVEEA